MAPEGTPAKPTTPGWRIQSQVRTKRPVSGGRVATGWTIHFVTANTVGGTVWVADATYTPVRVKAIISPLAANITAVGLLQG
jgi:hypothetical protein